MIERRYIVLIGALLLIFWTAGAQERPSWKFVQVPLTDNEISGPVIAQLITDGYYPRGLSIIEDEFLVLSTLNNSEGLGYFLKYFDDLSSIGTELSSFVRSGWNPVGLDSFAEGLLALFLNDGNENMQGWKLRSLGEYKSSELVANSNRVFSNELADGYIPFSLLQFNNELYIGFLKPPDQPPSYSSYIIDSYANDGEAFVEGINLRMNQGYTINGFQFVDNTILVAFLR